MNGTPVTAQKGSRFVVDGENRKVGENRAVVVFELEAWPEPKALSRDDLRAPMKQFKSTIKVASHIGASQAFV